MYTFSIVMPTYRRPHTLPRAVASVLAQTYPHWELILVNNDAGPLAELLDDPRIRVVHHAEKASAAHARNMGLGYATGDLVSFFDDDDEMVPTYLERFAGAFRADPRVQAVRCRVRDAAGRLYNSYCTPCVCLRRQYATPTWRPDGQAQDHLYYLRLFTENGWVSPTLDGWFEDRRVLRKLRAMLVNVHTDPRGGLRAGRF